MKRLGAWTACVGLASCTLHGRPLVDAVDPVTVYVVDYSDTGRL